MPTRTARNPLSGSELIWAHLDLQQLRLEVLVNRSSLGTRAEPAAGSMLAADVWLQGHVLDRRTVLAAYEGADARHTAARAWRHLKRVNPSLSGPGTSKRSRSHG